METCTVQKAAGSFLVDTSHLPIAGTHLILPVSLLRWLAPRHSEFGLSCGQMHNSFH